MATYRATTGNDFWTVPEFGDPSGTLIDGLAGTDTLGFDRLLRARFSIKKDASTGYILVDSVSGASSTYHLKLVNVEKLSFNNGFDVVDLSTLFGDTTPPLLSTISPGSGSTAIAVTANVAASFSEAIVRGTGNITLLDSTGVAVETFAAATSSRITVSGTSLVIDPTASLAYGKTYTVKIDAGAIKDTSGNSYAGLANYSFTTQPNTAPVTQPGSFTLQEDTVLTASVPVASDAQGQALTYQLVQGAAHGTVTLNKDGSFSYIPVADYAGSDSFTYNASDGELASSSSLISLTINNVIDRFTGTSGADKLVGTMAADQFVGGGGDDTIDGGGGIDTAIYTGGRSGVQIDASTSGWLVTDKAGTEGIDTLTNVERLQFADGNVALDIDGDAGRVAKLLGSIFGKAAVANQVYAGIGLYYFGLGLSYEQLAKLALNAALGANHTAAQTVNLLTGNVYGGSLSDSDKAFYVAQIDAGALKEETLAVVVSDSSNNAVNIDLVGLAQHGLQYQPTG